MLLVPKLLTAAAAFVSLVRANDPPQVPLSNSCVDDCDALGCNVNNGATPTTQHGTTIIPQVPSGPSPWSPPPGFPGATEAGTNVGPDGKTTVSWQVTQPTDIIVPNSPPTSPPCASWVVTSTVKTHIIGTETLIFTEPVLTAAGPTPITSWSTFTTTSTETSVLPPVTSTTTSTITETSVSVSTSTTTETTVSTTTSVPPPVISVSTITSWDTSTLTLPPSTTTETQVSTTTETQILPPITSWSTWTSTSTETQWSTSTSTLTLPPSTITLPPVTSWSTTTSIPPAETVTSTTTTTSVSTFISTSTTTSVSVSTTTATSTTSVSYCPPGPTTAPPPPTPCVPGIVTAWKNVDIYKTTPFTFTWNDPWPGVLKVQDAGYKTEQYSVAVDNGVVGTTSNVGVDAGAWCGISNPLAVYTCQAQGMSYGEFALPTGSHSVSVTNVRGIYNDAGNLYSTIFYQVERVCPNTYVPPKPACAADIQQQWTNVDVYEGRNYNLPTFNYNYPVKLTVVDAGYKSEKYYVIVDNVQVGMTHDYTTNWGVWCGITADAAQNCLNQGLSTGVFVIPSGSHSVAFSSISTRNPAWAAYSTLFFKVEKWCTW